jgi:hypothetical protein
MSVLRSLGIQIIKASNVMIVADWALAMKSVLIVFAVCSIAGSALAQEPVGCDKFKWRLDKERATLTGTDLPKLTSGGHVAFSIPFGTTVALVPFADAKLPVPSDRAPKDPNSFAGFLDNPAPKAATYKITLSSEGWIDVVQDGHALKSTAFSGATGCDGIRKSVKFDLTAKPFTVELSSVQSPTIGMTITGD